ncbi:MAG: DUF2721 domain-containing protein [Chlorobiaceae bacterium]|nr:DUF2721 domain-containing protein [Chlorobiaceae bacterium]NTW74355.1 DUF2721 domain-containing protein [Chlorobiaceae bacterium]
MLNTATIDEISHVIQLALAPVFLLSGIAAILNVISWRLARIVDRGRSLTEGPGRPDFPLEEPLKTEHQHLDQRRHLASSAITACTFSALLVCMVIAALFLEVLIQINFKWLIGILFTAATLMLVIGLAYFLREVHLGTRTLTIPSSPLPSRATPGVADEQVS